MPTREGQDDLKLSAKLLRFTSSIDELGTPDEVLDGLHKITFQACQLSVLCALLWPKRWGDWSGLERGKTVFLHKSAPKGWWEEYLELTQQHPSPGLTMAQLGLAPFTMSEMMRMLEPVGFDRWPIELALKYGIRDTLSCPVGGRWAIGYWSTNALSGCLTQERRALLFLGATFAAIRLQKIIDPHVKRMGEGTSLTPRELAVLRLLSVGKHIREIAELLEIGEETVRSHLKKTQAKLGVHSQPHAVAQAMRRHLIP